MLNLTYYQSLFNEDNTEIRCRQVLDEVAPTVKPLFDAFIERIGVSMGNEFYTRSYDQTLSTTYHDARNPQHADKKKESDIGRKYFAGLFRKVNGKEYNQIMLEFNGMNGTILIHTEVNFIPFWSWFKSDRLRTVLNSIPEDYSIFTGWTEKSVLSNEEMVKFVKECIKPRKRPWFQVGASLPMEGQLVEETLINQLVDVWERLSFFRENLNNELTESNKAYEALMSIAGTRDINETTLLGKDYTLEIAALEEYKTNGKRQAFHLMDGDQMVTKGFVYFMEFHEKFSPYTTIFVQIEGHNHIFTSVREILGSGQKAWWITKLFATHNLDNQQVMSNAMQLLREHEFEVKGTAYCVGTFNNDTQSFEEGAGRVKKNFIDAAILFAHASQKLELPAEDESGDDGDSTDGEPEENWEPNFNFEEIYQNIENSSFTFSKDIIRDLHLNLTALDDKHFVLLSGISGTGKTQLCRLYANAVYGLEYESENPYFSIIPVRPDWTDATAMFGYYSAFEKRYVKTEFLNVLLSALKERDKPHFILLDEMNLARVEYYLSDYLSAVESRKEIPLHQDEDTRDIPKKLMIPPNVYILGTINVDETTHSISDKVLDRAFVMTLSDVDFKAYWERVDQDVRAVLQKEFGLLTDLHSLLADYDLHFGYRTMDEMLKKLYANQQLPEEYQMGSLDALDRVISEKVLTKVRGDERISDMLAEVEGWLKENMVSSTISLTHVKRMAEELERYGATQFWR